MKDKENKIKFSEKFSLNLRKKWLVNSVKTFLIIAVLICAYVAIILGIEHIDLPKIDVTQNQIYTLSESSKEAIKNINQDIKIYYYKVEDNIRPVEDLLKQYNKINNKITYEFLTQESNYEMVQKYNLADSTYSSIILKSGDFEKIVSATEFTTYDTITYEQIDTAEQVLTNSILALTDENKPKVYFVEGHGEFSETELGVLIGFLNNEAFQVEKLNITTSGTIPEDCDILAIMSPSSDFFEGEVTAIKEYINKGGKIYFSMDTVNEGANFINIQSILDEYGVSVQNGYILENSSKYAKSQYPYIFIPQVSTTHKITTDIYTTKSNMWLMYSARLQFKNDDELSNLKVEKEILLSSSDTASFITDLSSDINNAKSTAQTGKSEIAAVLTKDISKEENTVDENDDSSNSKLIIVATGNFITDYKVPQISEIYPMSYVESNKDFVLNSMAYLGDKGNILTIRKDMSSSTYVPTPVQNIIVLIVVFAIPILIIIIGILVWSFRKKRK